ncbi:MAG: hypothetical protein IPL22_04840 [Bacteroidetes bacterium]|nr:hypothetical protein [Bacteroidota bacterium]
MVHQEPVILKRTEQFNMVRVFIGIYVSANDGPIAKVSYAVRLSDVGEWSSKILPHSIEKDSQQLWCSI